MNLPAFCAAGLPDSRDGLWNGRVMMDSSLRCGRRFKNERAAALIIGRITERVSRSRPDAAVRMPVCPVGCLL